MTVSRWGAAPTWVLAQLVSASGVTADPSAVSRFPNAYLQYLLTELEKPGAGKGVMPGVRTLLDRLAARADLRLALLTGNYQVGARAKLEYFDLWRYFPGGAFGDHAVDRNHLFHDALTFIASGAGGAIAAANVVVVGDTPLDVMCAAAGGGRSIAVATGNHSSAELRAAGADSVFKD